MTRNRTHLVALLLAAWLACGISRVEASGLNALAFGTLTVEITALDEGRMKLPGATIWIVSDSPQRNDHALADMQQLANRYYRDVDFIFDNALPDDYYVERAPGGIARVPFEKPEIGGLRQVRFFIAVLKRGYLPSVVAHTGKPGRDVKLAVTLRRDAQWTSDPRLQQLDDARALAMQVIDSDEDMSEATAAKLESLGRALRPLAETFEKEGKDDEAATVYYNLAHLPSILLPMDTGMRVSGYTRGFDAGDPQRVADREHAWSLARTHPALLMEQAQSHAAKRAKVFHIDGAREDRQRLVDFANKLLAEHPRAIWPSAYLRLWRVQSSLGLHDEACNSLRESQAISPAHYDAKGWQSLLQDYDYERRKRPSEASSPCVLAPLRENSAPKAR